jgi:exodeoxyribonuclease VII large subunit
MHDIQDYQLIYTVRVTDLTLQQPAGNVAAITVSELNRQARKLLEQGIARVWVEGEVSNLARPASGHVYFTLKDASAQLRCAWFKQRQRGPTIHLKNGDKMLALGKVGIYEARGEYQMVVERMESIGEGELRRRFELLKIKLQGEGLFDDSRKRELPALPTRIGIVTSPGAAAVRDILTVLKRRFPLVPVVIYPSAVQGDAAARELVTAINTAANRAECDLLIVSRGGGSLEDLWPFNEEIVARAISDCPIPLVSAVGHEVDFTIADFVADLRAATPSGAAELVVPDQDEWQRTIAATGARIAALSRRHIEDTAQTLDWLGKRLAQSSPVAIVARQRAWLRNLRQVMAAAMRYGLSKRGAEIERDRSRLLQQAPAARVQHSVAQLLALNHRLATAGRNQVQILQGQLNVIARGLHAVSPLATLERGYAIVTDSSTGQVVSDAGLLTTGDRISARLASGSIDATVTNIERKNEHDD